MRNGKIAKLSRDIREELNLRLHNGEDGPKLLQWLNRLPEVKETLAFHFHGVPVTKQNLSEWRRGGFRQWEIQLDWIHQACELRDYTDEMQDEVLDHELLAGNLIALVSVRYAALLNTWDGEPSPEFENKRRLLRAMAQDAALIQRTAQRAALHKADSEQRLEDDQQKHKAQLRKMVLSPVLARMEQDSVEKMLALFVDDKTARRMAEFVADLKYDINWQKKAKEAAAAPPCAAPEEPQSSRPQSPPVKPSQTSVGRDSVEPKLNKPSPVTPVASSQTNLGRARLCRAETEQTQLSPTQSPPVAPSQTQNESASSVKIAPPSPQAVKP